MRFRQIRFEFVKNRLAPTGGNTPSNALNDAADAVAFAWRIFSTSRIIFSATRLSGQRMMFDSRHPRELYPSGFISAAIRLDLL